MVPIIYAGATGSGKSTALLSCYHAWVGEGVRTDQILVLVGGAAQADWWRSGVRLDTHGPLDMFSYVAFIQRELVLHWGLVQTAHPEARAWVRPEFVTAEVAHHLMRPLVEARAGQFQSLKSSLPRIASQLAGALSTAGAAAGLTPAETAARLRGAGRPDSVEWHEAAAGALAEFRQRCLHAGIVDYSLALELFNQCLAGSAVYREHLAARYRCLLVDDLDETVPAEQDFLASVAGGLEGAVFGYSTDGGHSGFMGADAAMAWERFSPGARVVELAGSRTCSPEMFALGGSLAQRILSGETSSLDGGTADASGHPPAELISVELHSDMIMQVACRVAGWVDQGVDPAEIAVVSPRVDAALEMALARALAPFGASVCTLGRTRRLVDEPYARAALTVAGLIHPEWRLPGDSAGAVARAMQALLGLDPVRAALLGAAVQGAAMLPLLGGLPELEPGLRVRLGEAAASMYDFLRAWADRVRVDLLEGGLSAPREADGFVHAFVSEVVARLAGSMPILQMHACRQLLDLAYRFRLIMERVGESPDMGAFSRMVAEGTAIARLGEDQTGAVVLATPHAYLRSRLTARYQVWCDISSDGWYPSDVRELSNPHVLSRRWAAGERWTDAQGRLSRQTNAARLTRALARRCTGRLTLAECSMGAWGQEQAGEGLVVAFADLVRLEGWAP